MGNIKMSRKSYEDRHGLAQVIMTVTFHSEKVRIPTGLKASAESWDEEKQCFRGKGQSVADKNLIIEQLRSRVNNVLVKARLRDEVLTKESFLRYYSNPKDFDSFHDFMAHYYKKVYRLKEDNTLKTYRTIMKKVQAFAPGLSFTEINYDLGMRLLAHLRRTGVRESTVWKEMKTFKVFVEAAKREGYIERTTFDQIKIRKVKSEVVYLDEEEFRKLIDLYHSNVLDEVRQNVLRFFLFMASTSPHVGDAKDLRIEQFRMGELHYQRRKTRKDVTVPLTPLAEHIFEFYRRGRDKGLLFDTLPSSQKINKHLKEIAKEANIDKKISCKTARHTFATIFYRHSKDIYALKEILGHSDLKDTMVYAHLLDDAKLEGMKAFDAFT